MSILYGDGGMLDSIALGLEREKMREREVGRVCGEEREGVEVGLEWAGMGYMPTPPPTRHTYRHLTRHIQPEQLTSMHLHSNLQSP
jgi:hypothetical protein